MKELQLINLEEKDITAWDFDVLKEDLSNVLSAYKTTIYTDETIKLAKEDKAKLAKAKKVVEDKRKAFKSKCMEPYDALEPQIKELVAMIEEQRVAIDEVVKDYTDRQKMEKEANVKSFYDKKAHVLGDLAPVLYEKILDQKWLNSSSGKKYQEEMQIKINEVLSDIREIKSWNSPFVDTVVEKYISTLSVDDAKAKHEELIEAANRAGLGQVQSDAVKINQSSQKETTQDVVIDTENGTLVKMYGNKNQITQVMDFANAIGVKMEIQ